MPRFFCALILTRIDSVRNFDSKIGVWYLFSAAVCSAHDFLRETLSKQVELILQIARREIFDTLFEYRDWTGDQMISAEDGSKGIKQTADVNAVFLDTTPLFDNIFWVFRAQRFRALMSIFTQQVGI